MHRIPFILLVLGAACGGDEVTPTTVAPPSAPAPEPRPDDSVRCVPEGQSLRYGYHANYPPVSDVTEDGSHTGMEADLLDALEAMEGAGLAFERTPLFVWPDLWYRSATDEYDVMGGGITILDARRFKDGIELVAFTNGHLENAMVFLTLAEDAPEFAEYNRYPDGAVVGVARDSGSEATLLDMLGYIDRAGILKAGTTVTTSGGAVLQADGTDRFRILAGQTTENLHDRARLEPAGDGPALRFVVSGNQIRHLELLDRGEIDAAFMGTVTALHLTSISEGRLAVASEDPDPQVAGFTLDVHEVELLACLNEKIDYLTDDLRISLSDWLANPRVFMERALAWEP